MKRNVESKLECAIINTLDNIDFKELLENNEELSELYDNKEFNITDFNNKIKLFMKYLYDLT